MSLALPSLVGASRAEMAAVLAAAGVAPAQARMRLAQLWRATHRQGVGDWSAEALTPLGGAMREALARTHTFARPEVVSEQISQDGTRKWVLAFGDGAKVETVYIPDVTLAKPGAKARVGGRGAVCVSSQVGCAIGCVFCRTGLQKRVRNLTAAEIVAQYIVAADAMGEWARPREERRLANIVFMGMGEPLDNYENVRDAIGVLADGEGLAISRRRITVSTSGVVPQMDRLGEDTGAALAVSLHAPDDALRARLVPINRKWPLAELMAACRRYPRASNARRLTFEYVMLDGINDKPEHAKALCRLIAGIPAKVNLIPFNPWPGSLFVASSAETIAAFSQILRRAGYAAPVRTPRGRDILAACGQLQTETQRPRRVPRSAPPAALGATGAA